MRMKKSSLALLLPLLVGCVSPQQLAPSRSTADLCHLQHYGGPQNRAAANHELARRGIQCDAAAVAQDAARRQQHDAAMLGIAAGAFARPAPAHISPPAGPISIYRGDHVSGANRICFYDQAGSRRAITVPVTTLCPMNPP